MKKLVAILLLSFTLPLCAMEAAEDGSGSDRGEEVAAVTGIWGMTPSPARRPASEERDGREEASVAAPGESLGGGGGAASRVPVENSSPSSKWWKPKSPVFRIAVPATLGAIMIGGLARIHVKKQRALGKPTVFDRMGQWVQQRYRGLVRSPKKPAGEDGRREKTTSETSA